MNPPRRSSADAAPLLDELRRRRPWQRAPECVRQRALARLESELRAQSRWRVVRRGWALAAVLLLAAGAGWGLHRERAWQEAASVALHPERAPARSGTLPPTAPVAAAPVSASEPDVPDFDPTTVAVARGADPAWLAGPNLVRNGDFAAGDRLWSVRRLPESHSARGPSRGSPPLAGAAYRLREGLLCMSLSARQRILGVSSGERSSEPAGLSLAAHRRYRLSLRVLVTGKLPIELLVQVAPGASAPPFVVAALPRHRTSQYFTVDFEPAIASAAARIAFLARGAGGAGWSEICLDDIAVTENSASKAIGVGAASLE